MKRILPTVLATALAAAALPAAAADNMPNMNGMPTGKAEAAKTGQATGVVTGVDDKMGMVTIKHGPVPGVGWPAMTMSFKAMPVTLLKGVKAGDKVAFTVKVKGQDNEVTALRKQ
jgi:Cu(I)/Ag(I) efflux system protein CusF